MRKPREQSRILKKFPTRLGEVAREKGVDVGKIEIWFADEARIGQKNKITRRWAKRGTRPSAPRDQRGSDPALLQYRSDEPAPRGNRQDGRTRSPRCPPRRSGRMASVSRMPHSRQHHHSRPAAEMP